MTTCRTQLFSLAIAAIVTALAVQAQIGGATVVGSIQDSNNAAASGVTIDLTTYPPTYANFVTQTAADGSFAFANVPAGTYKVCARLPKSTLLDTCLWTTTPLTITSDGATPLAVPTVTMQNRYPIQFRIKDVAGKLALHRSKTPGLTSR